jgi:hypothetical protein
MDNIINIDVVNNWFILILGRMWISILSIYIYIHIWVNYNHIINGKFHY